MKKHTQTKRLLAFLLAALMAVSTVACSNTKDDDKNNNNDTPNNDNSQNSQNDNNDNDNKESETEPPHPEDLLPEHDFGGESFDFLIVRTKYAGQDYDDLIVEEDNAETIASATWTRQVLLEDKYKIKFNRVESGDAAGEIARLVAASDSTYEALQDKLYAIETSLAVNNRILNLVDFDGIDLDAEYYDRHLMDSASIAGKQYFIAGDIEVSDKMGVEGCMFNKALADQLQIPDLYEIVDSGKWTFDLMSEYAELASDDLDGNGKMEMEKDRFGIIAEDFFGWMFMVAGGAKIADKDENDIPYLTADTEFAIDTLNKIMKLMYNHNVRGGGKPSAGDKGEWLIEAYEDAFSTNRALFHPNTMSTMALFREMEADFGIIPLPKMYDTQTEYITTLSPWVSRFIAVPKTVENKLMVGAVLDGMARLGTNTVKKAYYETLLNGKISRDNDSSKMLDLIFSTVTVDIGSVYNWNNTWFLYQQFFAACKEDFVSSWKSVAKVTKKSMEKTIQKFTEDDGE